MYNHFEQTVEGSEVMYTTAYSGWSHESGTGTLHCPQAVARYWQGGWKRERPRDAQCGGTHNQ
jgi:hypothetical protein